MISKKQEKTICEALDSFLIEIPSWGFPNTGTRFGKFLQPGAALTIEEKMADAGQVHRYTGCCPTVAVHVLWDFSEGVASAEGVAQLASRNGIKLGAINPTLFEDQSYKYGSLGNPDSAIRRAAINHIVDSIELAKRVGSRNLSLWFADGSNYPATANIRHRRHWFQEGLREAHAHLGPDQRLLIEYKPFEPAFYHTDIADWGMAFLFARAAGPQAKVLVDTGHHYQAQNIEQIVAWLLDEDMLGGFHLNDRRYADDDLTLGSIDPYQVFRIFHQILQFQWENGKRADIAYMIDQSHNLKPKIEEMIQTVMSARNSMPRPRLSITTSSRVTSSTRISSTPRSASKAAFATDVRPVIEKWRRAKNWRPTPCWRFGRAGTLKPSLPSAQAGPLRLQDIAELCGGRHALGI